MLVIELQILGASHKKLLEKYSIKTKYQYIIYKKKVPVKMEGVWVARKYSTV